MNGLKKYTDSIDETLHYVCITYIEKAIFARVNKLYLKKLASIFLLIGIICQLFSSAFIIAGFEVNKKYIADKLCENKDNPKMSCEGRCQLKKHLQEEEKNQTSAPTNSKETFEIGFCNTLNQIKFFNADLLSEVNTFYNSTLPQQFVQPVFHPPGC